MNLDDSSVSQQFITNFQTSTPYSTRINNGTENISSCEVEVGIVSSATTHIDDGTQQQQQDNISSTETGVESCLGTASTFVQENHFSNTDVHKADVLAGNVISDKNKASALSSNDTNLSNVNDSTGICNINQCEATDTNSHIKNNIGICCNENKSEDTYASPHIKNNVWRCNKNQCETIDMSYYNDPSLSECQRVSDVSNEKPASLPAEEQNDFGLEIGRVPFEVNQYSSPLTSETMKQSQNSLAFIGPVLPSFTKGLESQEIYEEMPFSSQDVSLATSSRAHGENASFSDDLRYNLSVESVPRLVATASSDFQGVYENFLRGCKWSPDGSCVLTNSNDNCLRTFHPFDNTSTTELGNHRHIVSSVRMQECGQIYDYAWHPEMSSGQADFGRIACTCSGIPIHLWDVNKGQIVANYRAYDQFDEIAPAFSLAFSLDGRKIYSGYNKAIRIFDTEYPVRSCKTVKTYNSQRKDGQTGIISCFTFSPNGNGLYVAGSYSRHIGMYDSACDKLVCLMQGQHGGITHLMFSPDATKLYSGGRKDAEILCWDMRNMDKILFSALRDVKTNQRIYFDLSQFGRYLVSGNNDGTVAFWDTLKPVEEINGDSFLKPCSQFQAHGDCVNGISFNHQHNLVATSSGQRHFHNFDNDSSDSAEDESMEGTESWDFSLRLWQIPMLV